MNYYELAIKRLTDEKKKLNIFNLLKTYFKNFKEETKKYKNRKNSIDYQIRFMKNLCKSMNSKETKEVFDSFVKESYKNFIYSLEYYYLQSPSEEIKNMIESDKYKELIQYFVKEETFDIYREICQKTKYFDFYELLNINNDKTFNSEEQNVFMKNISSFISLVNSHLPKNLTEDDIINNFLSRVDVERIEVMGK